MHRFWDDTVKALYASKGGHLRLFGSAKLEEALYVLVVWIQDQSLPEIGNRTCIFAATMTCHTSTHPGSLEGGVERNSPE